MTTTDESEAVEQIARIREEYERAEKEGNFSPVAPYVAEDLVVLPPGSSPIEGKSRWEAIFNETMAEAPEQEYEIGYSSAETIVRGDIAFDRGTASDSAAAEDAGSLERGYNYLWLYRRTMDESWELTHIIWNSTD